MRPIHKAKVNKGKIEQYNEDRFDRDVQSYEGKEILISIKEDKSQRTLRQNRYYWKLLEIMEFQSEVGYTQEEWHEIFRQKFLDKKKYLLFEEEYNITASTTKLNTKEFTDYIEKIKRFASTTLQTYLPEPGEVDY